MPGQARKTDSQIEIPAAADTGAARTPRIEDLAAHMMREFADVPVPDRVLSLAQELDRAIRGSAPGDEPKDVVSHLPRARS